MTKNDGKSTSHRGKRGTAKKPPDSDDNPSKQVNIKPSKKQGQINISEFLKSTPKSGGKTTRRGRKPMTQTTDPGPTPPNTKTNNGKNAPAYDLNGKRIVDNISTSYEPSCKRRHLLR